MFILLKCLCWTLDRFSSTTVNPKFKLAYKMCHNQKSTRGITLAESTLPTLICLSLHLELQCCIKWKMSCGTWNFWYLLRPRGYSLWNLYLLVLTLRSHLHRTWICLLDSGSSGIKEASRIIKKHSRCLNNWIEAGAIIFKCAFFFFFCYHVCYIQIVRISSKSYPNKWVYFPIIISTYKFGFLQFY